MKTTIFILLFSAATSVLAMPTTDSQADDKLVTRIDDATSLKWTGDSIVSPLFPYPTTPNNY